MKMISSGLRVAMPENSWESRHNRALRRRRVRHCRLFTSKAALEAHTANLAAELAGSRITVDTFWPGSVDTAMQAWIRGQSPDDIGAALHERFTRNRDEGSLITPELSARTLLTHLHGDRTGEVWSVSPQQKGPSS